MKYLYSGLSSIIFSGFGHALPLALDTQAGSAVDAGKCYYTLCGNGAGLCGPFPVTSSWSAAHSVECDFDDDTPQLPHRGLDGITTRDEIEKRQIEELSNNRVKPVDPHGPLYYNPWTGHIQSGVGTGPKKDRRDLLELESANAKAVEGNSVLRELSWP